MKRAVLVKMKNGKHRVATLVEAKAIKEADRQEDIAIAVRKRLDNFIMMWREKIRRL